MESELQVHETPEHTSAEDDLARRCIDLLFDRDEASQSLGVEIAHITAGRAVLKMKVRDDMINGHDLVHGGLIFLLADTAIAFAGNSRNASAVPIVALVRLLASKMPRRIYRLISLTWGSRIICVSGMRLKDEIENYKRLILGQRQLGNIKHGPF